MSTRPVPPGASRRVRSVQQTRGEATGAVQALHVSIPLKPQQTPTVLPPRLAQAVKDEFAIRYLQKIGAYSSPENIALVLQHLPLEKCAVTAAWKSRGSLSDVLAIDLNPKSLIQVGDLAPPKPVIRVGSKADVLKEELKAAPSPQAPPLRQLRGRNTRREFRIGTVCLTFDDMKRKFLLPFKLAKPPKEIDVLQVYGTQGANADAGVSTEGFLSPNQKEQLSDPNAAPGSPMFLGSLGRWESHKRLKGADERRTPLSANADTVRVMHEEFFFALPLASLGLPEGDESTRSVLYDALRSTNMVELVQSTMQYLYLVVVNPAVTTTEKERSSCDLEVLFVSITHCFASLRVKMERKQRSTSRYQLAVLVPLLLLALRVDVETLVRLQYPFSFSNAAEDMARLLQVLDDKLSQLLDPDANWSRLAVLETTHEAGQARSSSSFQRARRHRRLRDQFYQTSAALHGVFPDPSSGKCRRMLTLRGGAGISQYPDFASDTIESATTKQDDNRLPDPQSSTQDVKVSVASKLTLLRSLRRSQV